MGGFPEVILSGVRIHRVDRAGFLAQIVRAIESGTGGLINNVNVHAMNLAWSDRCFRDILNASDLVYVDGAGVQLGARLVGQRLGERLTVVEWIDEVFDICVKRAWPVFLLGDTDEVGAEFERIMRERHPGLIFAGRHHGFFAKEGEESDAVVTRINESGAQLLLVGMSMPIQEKWVWHHRQQLKPPACLSVGGAARVVTGHIRRGPSWMTDNGLEWLYRLAVQPRYTWRRYLIGNPLFMLRLLGWSFFGLKLKDERGGKTRTGGKA